MRRLDTTWMLVALPAAALACGCGGPTAGDGAEAEGRVAMAGDEEEVWGFLPPPEPEGKPSPPPTPRRPELPETPTRRPLRPPPRRVREPRPWRPRREPDGLAAGILVRGGILLTVSADDGTWDPAGALGVGYRLAKGGSARRIYDFGVDYSTVERKDGRVTTDLWSLRGEVLFGRWSAWRDRAVVYLLGGGHALFADSTWHLEDEEGSSAAAGLELGVGFGSASGKWDLRAVYSLLAGSQNVNGNILIAMGWSL